MNEKNLPEACETADLKYFKTSTRFKGMVNLPRGLSISDAIKQADANVQSCKAASLKAVEENIAGMHRLCVRMKATSNDADERQIYLLANEVYASAAMFGQLELSEAAYSLCDLIGNRPSHVPLAWAAINVHVDSMRLIFQTPEATGTAARQAILEGLKQVTTRLIQGAPQDQAQSA